MVFSICRAEFSQFVQTSHTHEVRVSTLVSCGWDPGSWSLGIWCRPCPWCWLGRLLLLLLSFSLELSPSDACSIGVGTCSCGLLRLLQVSESLLTRVGLIRLLLLLLQLLLLSIGGRGLVRCLLLNNLRFEGRILLRGLLSTTTYVLRVTRLSPTQSLALRLRSTSSST